MAVRAALLTSRNINLDSDFSKYIETVSDPGVINGFAVTASAVATGQAWVPCERTNGETIYTFVQNFNSVAISGNGYVIISIPQNIIDNGGGNEDGTGIASIEVVNELPAKNYLLLATITGGVVEDNRNMIHTVGELQIDINTINGQITDLDNRVTALELISTIDHLEEKALVGENYALTDTLYKQFTPTLANSTVEAKVGDVAANTEVHIQRLGSGIASNKLKLKIKKTGSPTTDVKVEVRKGIKVNVSSSEAYWYGDNNNILATGTLTASSISSSFTEKEFTLDNEVGETEGELLDIVVYQTNGSGAIVNNTNYYVIACDSTQWSEAFSYVSVNGSTRSRSKFMPYCISDGFAKCMLSKVKIFVKNINKNKIIYNNANEEVIVDSANIGQIFEGEISFVSHTSPSSISSFKTATGHFNVFGTNSLNYSIDTNGKTMADMGTVNYSGTVTNTNLSWVPTTIGTHGSVYNVMKFNFNIFYQNTPSKKIKVYEVKSIGTKATAYLFGILPNGTWWDGN